MLSNYSEAVSRARRRSGVGVLSEMLLCSCLFFIFFLTLDSLFIQNTEKLNIKQNHAFILGGKYSNMRHHTFKYPVG